ncbi:MAG TPA: Fe-S cluster assembly protein SufD [Oculatellaceae cyanobacterium]|jgi:Fe-S cluster assembly protein SufD
MTAAVLNRTENLTWNFADGRAIRERLDRLTQACPDSFTDVRFQALERFEALGMPTRRLEAWKYINLRPLMSQPFCVTVPDEDVSRMALKAHWLADESVIRLVFVNGRFNEALSENLLGLSVGSLKDAEPEQVQALLSERLGEESDAFAALNTALFEDGAFISVADEQAIDSLIQVLFVTTSPEAVALHHRNIFLLGKQAKARFLVQHVGLTSAVCLNNTVSQFVLKDGAQAECTLVLAEGRNSWNLFNTRCTLGEHAALNLTTVALGGAVNRHSVSSLLQGEKAELRLNGLDVLDGRTEMYHHIVTEHWVPNAVSEQTYKGILDEESKSEFNSLVFVATGADGTDSHQLHKVLLLSDDARVWTRPQLQINADDVKCAHGAAVGQLEEEQLFYLASRGLSRGLAKSLLTYGFAEDVIQRIADPLVRQYLDVRVLDNLHGACAVFKKELGA